MTLHIFRRCSIALALVALASGCSSPDSGPWTSHDARSDTRSNECRWNRSSCIHEGSYEPGERDYAEEEARRLNRASMQRLRRSGLW